MAKGKKDGVIDMHLKFYPEKFKSHRELMEQLRLYQSTMGLGVRDAFVMMLLHPGTLGKEERKKEVMGTSGKKSGQSQPQESGVGEDRKAAKFEVMKTKDSLHNGERQEDGGLEERRAAQENTLETADVLSEDLFSESDDMENAFSSDFYGGSV